MTQILLVIKKGEASTIFQGKLAKRYGVEVVLRNSSADAIYLLEILPSIDIIICKDIIGSDHAIKKVCDYLSNRKGEDIHEVRVAVFGDNPEIYPNSVSIGQYPTHDEISDYVGTMLGREKTHITEIKEATKSGQATTIFQAPDLKETDLSDLTKTKTERFLQEEKDKPQAYVAMSTIYFVNLPEVILNFSVYTRIKKGDDFEYIKKFSANSILSPAEIERVLNRSGKDLYIAENEVRLASAFLNASFIEQFKKESLELRERMELNSDSFEILLEIFKFTSFDKFNIEIVKELVKSLPIVARSYNFLPNLLELFGEKKLSYGYTHSQLTLYLLLQTVESFSWGQDYSKNKLTYLALFHDLTLTTDRLIKIHHNYLDEEKNLTYEEKQVMFGHADACATTLESIVNAPKELTELIREHHGIKNGKGFPEALNINLTPTSMAFIAIESFVTSYLASVEKLENNKNAGPPKEELELIFTELKKKYSRLTYSEVIGHLQKFFNNK